MKILVTGDFIIDSHILKGNRMHTSSSATEKGTRIFENKGGANLTYELLKDLSRELPVDITSNVKDNEFNTFIDNHPDYISYIEWEKHTCQKNQERKKLCEKKWDYTPLGYGSQKQAHSNLINFFIR